ncbi:MAG: TIGR02391 family protein, partial [Vulcanimicrobiaceae bacterium]
MNPLQLAFETPEALVNATPADLGLVILRALITAQDAAISGPRRRYEWIPTVNVLAWCEWTPNPAARLAVAEGLAWLFSHDLVAEFWDQGSGSQQWGTVMPTRLGREIASVASQKNAAAYAMRAIELVPKELRGRVLPNLVAGEYDLAITAAFKAIEVRMRERAGLTTSSYGSRLAKAFFQRVASTRLQH